MQHCFHSMKMSIYVVCSSALNDTNVDVFECVEIGIEKYKYEGKLFISCDFNSRTTT